MTMFARQPSFQLFAEGGCRQERGHDVSCSNRELVAARVAGPLDSIEGSDDDT